MRGAPPLALTRVEPNDDYEDGGDDKEDDDGDIYIMMKCVSVCL